MSRRTLARLGFMLLAGVAALPAGAVPPSHAANDTQAFLPDSFVLARVDEKPIRVKDFVATYFVSYAEFRPRPDSAGRVEFLNTMINKEVMAKAAAAVNQAPRFEDRLRVRQDTETVLANTLFQRAVLDSAIVTEAEMLAVYESYKYDQHLRQIIFDDRATADRVRRDLVAKKVKWDDAVRRYHRAERDTARGSDLGWVTRGQVDPAMAPLVFALGAGQISPIISDRAGHRIFQSVERRPARVVPFGVMRRNIRNELANAKSAVLARRLQQQVGASIGIVYDSTNIAWAAARYRGTRAFRMDQGKPTLEVEAGSPDISPADTGRVLARHRHGQISLATFAHTYAEMTPLARPDIGDFESFRSQLDAVVLAPYMSQLALARGLDRDSLTVATLERRREQFAVDRLYQDSIATRIWISPEQRRKYYDDHIAQYHTYASVRFAGIVRRSKASADSVVAALKAGATSAQILHADSLRGEVTGSIQERREDDRGAPYHKLLMQDLRPGQPTIVGPDRQGDWLVLEVLTSDPGRQLSFKEAEQMVDESLQNIEADRLLTAFFERRRKLHRIESHPELVMRVRLSDPSFGD